MNEPLLLTELKKNSYLQVFVTLVVGGMGALAATAAGFPAAALIGAPLAVSVCSFCRLPVFIPTWLRNMAFAAIGCTLGSGVSRDLFDLAVQWPLSFCGLFLVMGAVLFTSSWILTAFFEQSRETAILAASPGALSYSLAVAATGVGNTQAIIVIQSIRLLSITTVLPLMIDFLAPQCTSVLTSSQDNISFMATTELFLATLAIGFLMDKKHLPAAFMIAGVLTSGLCHYFGLVVGRPQTGFLNVGFVITGAVIGAIFTYIPLYDIKRLVGGALAVVAVSITIAVIFAALAAKLLGVPLGQLWVSYSPGGVEAMAAMAIALGYDSAFVATHHLIRIILLLLLLPIFLKIFGQTSRTVSVKK